MFIGIECGWFCKEYKNYRFLIDGINNEVVKKRADESLKFYLVKAVIFKGLSNAFSVAAISLPLIATFATSSYVSCPDVIIPIITALTAFVSSAQALSKCADKKAYRNYAESLKNELFSFHLKIGEYNISDNEEREQQLAKNINKITKESNDKISIIENDNKKTIINL